MHTGDVYGLVHEHHLGICCLVLEVIPVSLSEDYHLLNIIRCSVRDFNRIRLDMSYGQSELILHIVLEVDHEQRAPLRDNIVDITRIPCRVVELSARQPVHRVDRNLQRLAEFVKVVVVCDLNKTTFEELTQRVKVFMLDRHTSLFELAVALSVRTEQVKLLNRRRMHRSDIEKGDVLVISRFGIYVATLPGFSPRYELPLNLSKV